MKSIEILYESGIKNSVKLAKLVDGHVKTVFRVINRIKLGQPLEHRPEAGPKKKLKKR